MSYEPTQTEREALDRIAGLLTVESDRRALLDLMNAMCSRLQEQAQAERGMSPQEICELLKAEFPGRYTSFGVDCNSHSHSGTNVQMQMYSQASGIIDCTSVAEGIRSLHAKLGDAVEPPVGADVLVTV